MSTLQSLTYQLSQQQSRLNWLTQNRVAQYARKAQLQRRLSDVNAIRQDAALGLSGDGDTIKRGQKNFTRSLDSAVKHSSHAGELISQVEGEYESSLTDDWRGRDLIGHLDQELSYLRGQIEDVEGQIRQSDTNIRVMQGNIKATNRSIKQAQSQQA